MNKIAQYGKWACVIGGAEGLGAAFCRELAKQGKHLLIFDQKMDQMHLLSEELENNYPIEVELCELNLENQDASKEIFSIIKQKECRLLVYNAAYGPVMPFLDNSEKDLNRYCQVNMVTMLHLVQQFVKIFADQPSGIMLLSSLAGFRGTSYVVPYAATKAFIWNMAEGLYYEYKDSPLDVSVCCPGPIDTPNYRSTNLQKLWFSPQPMSPQAVAREGVKGMGRQLFIIPGWSNKIAHLLMQLVPRKWASGIHNYTMKKMFMKGAS